MAVKQEETLRIEGMSCGHCIKAVHGALDDLDGVDVHDVEIGSATISYDPDAVPHHRIVAAIEEEGYTVAS